MRNIDFSPLYRSAIGFDRLFNMMEEAKPNSNGGYPPYNIELLDENHYRISMAVAGFAEAQLDITQQQNTLVVKGNKAADINTERRFLYQGIADRNFERKFQLADHVNVVGAEIENGLLHIELQREVPEEMKPRKIAIGRNELIENN